jgi:hypothetical protein
MGNKDMMIPEPREARKGDASVLETEFDLVEKGDVREPGSPLYPQEKVVACSHYRPDGASRLWPWTHGRRTEKSCGNHAAASYEPAGS